MERAPRRSGTTPIAARVAGRRVWQVALRALVACALAIVGAWVVGCAPPAAPGDGSAFRSGIAATASDARDDATCGELGASAPLEGDDVEDRDAPDDRDDDDDDAPPALAALDDATSVGPAPLTGRADRAAPERTRAERDKTPDTRPPRNDRG